MFLLTSIIFSKQWRRSHSLITTASLLSPSLHLTILLDPVETSQKAQGSCSKENECFPMLQTKDVLNFLTVIMYQNKMWYLSSNFKMAFCPLVIISNERNFKLGKLPASHCIRKQTGFIKNRTPHDRPDVLFDYLFKEAKYILCT